MSRRENVKKEIDSSVSSENTSFTIPLQQVEEATLSWRNDPFYNFSDWKLKIKIRDDSDKKINGISNVRNPSDSIEKTYYVHRNILAIGERRSGYFANLLHYGIDDGNRSSSIELCSRAGDHFPDLLDFMYSSKAFAVTTSNAIALLYLSQAFQVLALESSVKEFIDKDISLNNFGHYLAESLYFSQEKIALKVIDTCEKEVMSIMNKTASSADLRLDIFLNFPLLSSAIKVEKFCNSVWSILSQKQLPFKVKKNIFLKYLRQKAPG